MFYKLRGQSDMMQSNRLKTRPGAIINAGLIGMAAGFILCLILQGIILTITPSRGIMLNLAAAAMNLIFLIKTRNPGHLIMMVLCMIQMIH